MGHFEDCKKDDKSPQTTLNHGTKTDIQHRKNYIGM